MLIGNDGQGLSVGVGLVMTCLILFINMSCDQRVWQTIYHHSGGSNLLREDKVASRWLCLLGSKIRWWYLHKICQRDWTPSCLRNRKKWAVIPNQRFSFPFCAALLCKTLLLSDYWWVVTMTASINYSVEIQFYPRHSLYVCTYNGLV